MEVEVEIDDDLFEAARELAGPGVDDTEILHEALRIFIEAQMNKRHMEMQSPPSPPSE
ncbi:MAG: type II toxin-antitoxin system VapB family antitoxin [Comamonadaceae bacterium]|jgi:hypothetical protein|nr:type II toxin-antitoxin system VapB family antitoxin [Comamonadaceae bacterium]